MLITLSKVTTPVINWISQLLGWLMNGIYEVLYAMGTEKIGFSIIIYTLIVYLILLPIQIRTQKQSKMMSFIQPEMNIVQKRYRGRRDQDSMMKMNAEMQEIYAKYGFSPYGSCLPLGIQMVLLIGVYQVIYHIPGYVSKIGNMFTGVAEKIFGSSGAVAYLTQYIADNQVRVTTGDTLTSTNIVDILYLLKPSQWTDLINAGAMSDFSTELSQLSENLHNVNYFMGMNISMSPWDIIKESFSTGAWGFLLLAIAIPVLAWFTQWLGIKLTPQQPNTNAQDATSRSMQSMNLIMPIFSAFICATLSVGVGIYWITGAVFRAVQMVFINRSMMKWDMDELIQKNLEKAKKKKAKKKANSKDPKEAIDKSRVNQQAFASRKSIRKDYINDGSSDAYYESSDPNSMFNKVNMVAKYNDAHKGQPKTSHGNKNRNNRNNRNRNDGTGSVNKEVKSVVNGEKAPENNGEGSKD